MRREPFSFWLISLYLLFEYVRPQTIYEGIAFLPWVQLTILACLGVFILEGKWFQFRGAPDYLIATFTLIVLASSVTAYDPAYSRAYLSVFLSWVLIYVLISNVVVTERRFLLFIVAFLLYNLKMSLFATRSWAAIGFQFRDWGVQGAPGFFSNSGEFGIEMTIFVPLATCFFLALYRRWGATMRALVLVLPFTAFVGIMASSSRGAVLGLVTVGAWFIAKSQQRARTLVAIGAIAVMAVLMLPEEAKDRFETAGSDNTSIARLIYWKDGISIANQHPALGIGYWNWMAYYPTHNSLANSSLPSSWRPQVPHNIFIQAWAELGYSGFLAFLGLILASFVTNRETRRLVVPLGQRGRFLQFMAHGLDGALVGLLTSGFFVTVLYYPYFWINLAMTVALSRAARHAVRSELATAGGKQRVRIENEFGVARTRA